MNVFWTVLSVTSVGAIAFELGTGSITRRFTFFRDLLAMVGTDSETIDDEPTAEEISTTNMVCSITPARTSAPRRPIPIVAVCRMGKRRDHRHARIWTLEAAA
jgi:hypothetical protein